MPLAAIAYCVFLGYITYLQDGSFQCAHIIDNAVINGTDTIQTDTQPYHVELCTREALNTCRIADVPEYLMRKCFLQLHGCRFKHFNLSTCKRIELCRITTHKMREYRTGNHCILSFQPFNQSRHIFGSKAQAMHTRIQFYMNREVSDSLLLRLFNQCIQQVEAIHFWFQFIVEHGLERGHLRVHNDDACRNTRFAEFGTFISHSHSQKIDMMFLQCLGNLIRTGSIG